MFLLHLLDKNRQIVAQFYFLSLIRVVAVVCVIRMVLVLVRLAGNVRRLFFLFDNPATTV